MPEYKCECCNFKTPIKCKFESHLETKKHLSNVNIMEEDKDKIIESLRQENMFLKGKVEAYEMMMKASHLFNLLDARRAISVTERARYIGRIRGLARSVAR